MKKIYIALMTVVAVCTAISAVWAHSVTDDPYSKVKTYNDLVKLIADVPVGTQRFEEDIDADKAFDKQLDIFHGNTLLSHYDVNVFIAKVKEKLTCTNDMYVQQVYIEKVIGGDQELADHDAEIASYKSMKYSDDGQALFSGCSFRNLMLPGERYLIFCEKAETSDYYKTPKYRALMTPFSCLAVDSDNILPIEDEDTKYSDCVSREFLIKDQKTADVFMEIKHRIIKEYMDS